jgi:arginyl-tRNA synthetase
MLLQWEAGDPKTIALWKQMNKWVYEGFDATYKKMGVRFDKLYYESDTYLLGKDVIAKGLAEGIFYEKEDGSVWIDLTKEKLDHKLVLRSDGTSVYITQDIGTAQVRYQDFGVDKMVYVVADEQNYHFQVLFKTLERMGAPYAAGLHHLSYGMVDLPSGRMKSREGTVVDADDLIDEVVGEARKNSQERDTLSALSEEEQADIIYKIGLGALKFFIIKVNPQKRMTFDPSESVDMQGHTGPYVQNAYVRVRALLRKAGEQDLSKSKEYTGLKTQEKEILNLIYTFPELILASAEDYDPSAIANYSYDLAKSYHRLWHDLPILKAETEAAKAFRLQLSQVLANVLKFSMNMLGIEMPDRM